MTMIKKILVPIDFSDYSRAAINYAKNFAKTFNAKLFFLNVVEPFIYAADFTMSQAVIPNIETNAKERSLTELNKLVTEEIGDELETEVATATGKPFLEIIEYASKEDIDLIIIPTHGHTGVEHLLFGSTAEKVVRKAPCPVLTIREPLKGFRYNK